MGLRVNTNVQSLAAQRALQQTIGQVQKNQEKMASGSRIVRSADDSAGLAISQKMDAHIRSMRQAARNAGDGISLVQTAEGGMTEISNILVRMRELSIQAASDTIGDKERSFIDKEIVQLREEVGRISTNTEFNGRKLLSTILTEEEQDDPELAKKKSVLEIQVGVMNDPKGDRISIDLSKFSATLDKLGIPTVSVASKEQAQENLNMLDAAIYNLSEGRSELGAIQNRLDKSIRNLQVYDENLTAAKSRIADADVAEVATDLTKNNILATAGVAVLSQANQNPKMALQLL